VDEYDRQRTRERIRALLLRSFVPPDEAPSLGWETPLVAYGIGADSVATLELVLKLEEEFGVEIDEGAVEEDDLESIDSLCRLVERAARKPGGG